MKKLIFLVLILSSSIVHSEQVKLSCNISVTEYWKDHPSEETPKQYHVIYEVEDNGTYKSITTSSNNLPSITTIKNPKDQFFIVDSSDSNKWDILRDPSRSNKSRVSIKIDRNLGDIFTNEFFVSHEGHLIRSLTGEGNCEKVDVKKSL